MRILVRGQGIRKNKRRHIHNISSIVFLSMTQRKARCASWRNSEKPFINRQYRLLVKMTIKTGASEICSTDFGIIYGISCNDELRKIAVPACSLQRFAMPFYIHLRGYLMRFSSLRVQFYVGLKDIFHAVTHLQTTRVLR